MIFLARRKTINAISFFWKFFRVFWLMGYFVFYPQYAFGQNNSYIEPTQCNSSAQSRSILEKHPETYNFYLENDLFAGSDRGYTSGVKVSWVSASLDNYANDPCLPPWVKRWNRALKGIHPGPFTSRNMVITFGQLMYTPADRRSRELIPDDRPYAGWLYLGLGYNARTDLMMDTAEMNLGIIGPASLARESQNFIHRVRGIERFEGWNNQLHNELGLQLVLERKYRQTIFNLFGGQGDSIFHYGSSLGNVATYLNTGVEFRFGTALPNDFGTAAIRPAGDNNAPLVAGQRRDGYGIHGFASIDGRWVLHTIFLDGNTFSDSHSVRKKHVVGDIAIGIAWRWKGGKLAFARYQRSKEFVGQAHHQGFGSVTLSLDY